MPYAMKPVLLFSALCSAAPLSQHPNRPDWQCHFLRRQQSGDNFSPVHLATMHSVSTAHPTKEFQNKGHLHDYSAHTYPHSAFLSLSPLPQSFVSSASGFLRHPRFSVVTPTSPDTDLSAVLSNPLREASPEFPLPHSDKKL